MIALQDQAYVANIRTYAVDPAQRQRIAAQILAMGYAAGIDRCDEAVPHQHGASDHLVGEHYGGVGEGNLGHQALPVRMKSAPRTKGAPGVGSW